MIIPEARGCSLLRVLGRRAENYHSTFRIPGTTTEVSAGIYAQIMNVEALSREAT
jgi:hypothetical protein